MRTYNEAKNEHKQAIARAVARSRNWLADQGYEIGAGVVYEHPSYPRAVYRLTRVTYSDWGAFWLYGQKLRRDGTYSDHEHSIGEPDRVRPL